MGSYVHLTSSRFLAPPTPPARPAGFPVIFLAPFIAAATYFTALRDFVSTGSMLLLGACFVVGFFLRGSRILASLAGLAAAVMIGHPLGIYVYSFAAPHLNWAGSHSKTFLPLILATFLFACVACVVNRNLSRLLQARPKLLMCDRLLGMVLGVAEGIVILVAMTLTATLTTELLDVTDRQRAAANLESANHYPNVARLRNYAAAVQGSSIGNSIASRLPWDTIRASIDLQAITRQIAGWNHRTATKVPGPAASKRPTANPVLRRMREERAEMRKLPGGKVSFDDRAP